METIEHRITPWKNPSEWLKVHDIIFKSKDFSLANRKINIWSARTENLPWAVSVTQHFLAYKEYKKCRRENVPLIYQNLLITALSRFVSEAIEKLYKKHHVNSSMSHLGEKLGIPDWVVQRRHDCVHGKIPVICELEEACRFCWKYLKKIYWRVQYQSYFQETTNKITTDEIRHSLRRAVISFLNDADIPSKRIKLNGDHKLEGEKETILQNDGETKYDLAYFPANSAETFSTNVQANKNYQLLNDLKDDHGRLIFDYLLQKADQKHITLICGLLPTRLKTKQILTELLKVLDTEDRLLAENFLDNYFPVQKESCVDLFDLEFEVEDLEIVSEKEKEIEQSDEVECQTSVESEAFSKSDFPEENTDYIPAKSSNKKINFSSIKLLC